MVSIIDNFLEEKEFDQLQTFIMGNGFPWYFVERIVSYDDIDNYHFGHLFYENYAPISSEINAINPIVEKIRPVSLFRIKANLLPKTPNTVENAFHIDMGMLEDSPEKLKEWTTAILYVNTNNGYTTFEDGTVVESVANRFISFPADLKHHGASCTDEQRRVVINFNYFMAEKWWPRRFSNFWK